MSEFSNACIPPTPISEMTEYEIAWYRANPERCWDCLRCERSCKCRPKAKRRTAARPARQPVAVAEVIQFAARAAAPAAPASEENSPTRGGTYPTVGEPAKRAPVPAAPEPARVRETVLLARYGASPLVEAHLRHMELSGKRPNSVTHRARSLARLQAWLGDTPLADATAAQLYEWRASIAGLTDGSVVNYVSQCRSFYDWLAGSGHRDDNPARRLPVPRQPQHRPRPISEDDLKTALDSAEGRVRLWLVLAGWAGMRCVEIAQLRSACVRHLDSPPHIEIRADATKGGRDGRLIDLCPFAVEEISRYPVPAGEWMFPASRGPYGPVTAHKLSQIGNNHLRSAGIADSMHALRHRFGTMAYAASGDLVAVQNLMGHANPATTTGYVKVLAGRGTAIVGALPVPGGQRP